MGEESGKRLICIVEDDPEIIKLLTIILQKGNRYEVISAMGGEQGLEVIGKTKPDLVLLDLMMPDKDGWAVLQQMKDDEDLQSIPVIIVTAKPQKGLEPPLPKADDYLTKPLSPKELTAAVERVLGSQ